MKKIGHGAEAVVYQSGSRVIKERPHKAYRHPALEAEIRSKRTRTEARLMEKARIKGVNAPRVLKANEDTGIIEYEFVEGERMRDALTARNSVKWCCEAGKQVRVLHFANIIHGDLTTSNFLVSGKKLWVIDFGLSYSSHRIEDKATDLHVFKEALESTHSRFYRLAWKSFLVGYRGDRSVLTRLSGLEARGRYKKAKRKKTRAR